MASKVSILETVDKLNGSLPINISANDVENNPEFVNMLVKLSRNVNSRGMSKDVAKEYEEALDELQEKKRKYLCAHTLFTELKDILSENEVNKLSRSNTHSTDRVYDALQATLSTVEAVEYLDFTPEGDKDVTLLGLTPEELLQDNAHLRNQQQSFQQHVIPELESRLKSKCEMLVNVHNPSNENDSVGLSFAKAGQLPVLLAKDKRTLEDEKRLLKQDHYRIGQQFRQYYKALMQCLQTLEQIISKHCLLAQMEYDKITSNWLSAKYNAMCLKIRVIQNQLIKDTYTPGAMTALRKIRGHLLKAEEAETKELQRAHQALQAYESVGMGFDQLVKEYTILLREIDNKKWALSELMQTGNNDIDDLWK